MGFFDWLSQLRMTPTYSVLIAAIFTPIITGLVAYLTLRHQRRLASREHNERRRLAVEERDDKRYEKFLDAVAGYQGLVMPARNALTSFIESMWGRALFDDNDDIRQRVVTESVPALKSIGDLQHQLSVVYLRAVDIEMLKVVSSASQACHSLIRLVEQFAEDAKVGIKSAYDGDHPHAQVKNKHDALERDLELILQMSRTRLTDPA